MKRVRLIIVVTLLIFLGATLAMATEKTPYTVLKTDNMFELRKYSPQVLAEIIVDGDLEDAGHFYS